MAYIYALIDMAKKVRYVGKTQQTPQARLLAHLRDAYSGNKGSYLHCWIRSLNYVPRVIVLETNPLPDLNDAERRWISDFRSRGSKLCNMTDGGDGVPLGFKHRPEVVEKQRGRKLTLAHRRKIGASRSGRKHSAESRAKISASSMGKPGTFTGRKHKRTTLKKMSKAQKGHPVTKETRAKISASKKRSQR